MNAVVEFLEGMTIWRWGILGAVLLIAELLTGTTYLLWPAAAAFATGVIVFGIDLPWQFQWLIFAGLTIALTVLGDRFVRPNLFKSSAPNLNRPREQMVGARAIALNDFRNGLGRVKIGDVEWTAELDGASDVAAGTSLTVTSVESSLVRVIPRAVG